MAVSSSGAPEGVIREHADTNNNLREPNGYGRNVNGKGDEQAETSNAPPPTPQAKPSIFVRLGLDVPTLTAIFKGALAPVIGLAIYQSDTVAQEFSTVGYLVGIVSVLSLTILPRGKFVQTLVLNVLFAGVGAAIALLILWSSLQARLHTQTVPDDPRSPRPSYNSSQAAVSAVWLFANIWIVNTIRAKYPSANIPSIVYSIVTNITCTFSPLISSNAAFEAFVRQLLTAILTGFAIAAATSLLIIPVPSRAASIGQLKGAIMLLRGAVKQEKIYLQSLEREDMFAVPADICAATHLSDSENSVEGEKKEEYKKSKKNDEVQAEPRSTAEAKAIKETMFNLRLLSGKIYVDMPFAKRDIAWAKLTAKDLATVLRLLRSVIIPVHGIGTVIDIFQRLAEKRGWITTSETPLEVLAEKNQDKRVWNEVMKELHEPFEQLSVAIDEGLQHAGMLLEILPRPKAQKSKGSANRPSADADVESKGDLIQPGEPGFAEALKGKIQSFRDTRGAILRTWANEKGLVTDDSSHDKINNNPFPQTETEHRRDQEQLYILLYMETLMQAAGNAVLQFVQFADSKVADGTMARKRLIIPKPKVLRKWLESVFNDEDKGQENNADLFDTGMAIVCMGDSFAQKRDPEHLPPATAWQRLGNVVRAISKFLSSEESAFGFRCACATLTIGIVAFLENTYVFFQQQRLVWAMIIIAIGMTQTSGQSVYGFVCRVFGTFVALVFSLITWYIVDEKVPGIFVFLYLFQAFSLYFLLKYPQFIPAIMICMVTHVLIIGYELQVLKIGVKRSEATGQPYYPIYILAPYRLATVAGGCAVAFFWTIFPSPVTERTWLRRDLAATLYLLANYFSVINETLKSKLHGTGGDRNIKGTPAYHLAKHRLRLFSKLMLLLPALKQHADFQRWEPTIGGRFPREIYEDIILRASRINSYLTLLSYTIGGGGTGCPEMTITDSLDATMVDSKSKPVQGKGRLEGTNNRAWLDALAVLLADISPMQNSIVSTLTLLSNALQSGHSIPPHLTVPRPYELTRQLEAIDAATTGNEANGGGSSSDISIKNVLDGTSEKVDNHYKIKTGIIHALLDARNMTQAGYAEFAVLQVCSSLVCDDIGGLVESVSKLVGVVDFSFCVGASGTSTSSSESAASSILGTDSDGKGKGKVD
ncbi:hypothetical protein F5Y19DRAFT_262256 [Xylariaceae sp. FL1651]|nr:hypothetical protein F5Y19DRAFT_262256 [Xylariaceae sp. FL1651]